MSLPTHGDQKYQASSLAAGAAEWSVLRVEHRQIGSGVQNNVRAECTELVHILGGQARVRRRADGPPQDGLALPGTSWLVPAGTDETLLELEGSTECLIIFLPANLLADTALVEHGIDPSKARMLYEGGFFDPVLAQISQALRGLVGRPRQATDQLFVDGLQTALAAHLIGHYNIDRLPAASRQPSLEPRRLQRVLNYIDARLGESLSLDDLAGEACLSPFHFSRLFHEAMGRPPHRYVIERRIKVASEMIAADRASLAEVALDVGFGSQASFSRAFRKSTGFSPREFRDLHRSRGVTVLATRANSKFGT